MANFIGLGDAGGELVYEIIMIAYRVLKFLTVQILDGLGSFMEVSLEYLVKFVYDISKWIHR